MPSLPGSNACRLLRRLFVDVLATPSGMFSCGSTASAVVSDTAFLPHDFEPSHRQNPRRVSSIGSRPDISADATRPRNRSSLLGTLQHVNEIYVYSSSQRDNRITLGRRVFSVAGPMAWNALPDDRPPRPVAQCRQFQEEAKDASVSECTWTRSALEALRNALYKFKTYLLTYLLMKTKTMY